MKRIYFLALGVFFSVMLSAQVNYKRLVSKGTNTITVIKSDINNLSGIFSLEDLKAFKVKTKHGDFTQLTGNGLVKDFSEIGKPMIPVFNRLIEIPGNADISIKIVSYDSTVIDLNQEGLNYLLIPTQPSIPKNVNPDDLPFEYNKAAYTANKFTGYPLVRVKKLGRMRGITLGRLIISPVSYNPATNKLIVYTNISFNINFSNFDKSQLSYDYKRFYSPYYNSLFSKTLLNHNSIEKAVLTKDEITSYPIKMVIITDPAFENQLDQYIYWKHQKGFNTILVTTDDIGNTTDAIHNYLQNLYTSATATDPAPTFVLLVGDIGQIPAYYSDAGYYSKYTDLYYCTFDGSNDIYPDMYYGRWSAEDTTELQSYLDKTLEYERYTMPDDSYLGNSVLVAGVDASNASTYGNGQINYASDNYVNASHNFTTVYEYLYGSGTPITSDDAVAADSIHAQVSRGAGFVNYTAHCSSDGWADPSFTQSDALALQNAHKYCVMMGNCCQSNKFDESDAFGEVITHTPDKGCVAYIGASQYSLWDEDYWFAVGATTVSSNPSYDTHLGAYDRVFHDHGEDQSEWYETTDQLIHAGNLAVTEAGSSNETYYWEIYHCMGDPSISIYMGMPEDLSVSYNNIQPVGINSLTVTTEPNAYVAVSDHGQLLDAQLVGASGSVTLSFTSATQPDTFDIVVTKQFKKPYLGKLYFVSAEDAYVSLISNSVNDSLGNNNNECDYGEDIFLNITLKNVGQQDASNVTATLSTTDQYITITDNTENCGNISAGTQLTYNNAFRFLVADSIPDQHPATFTLTLTDANDSVWTYNLTLLLNSPVLNIPSFTVDDSNGNGNGHADPGESITLNFTNQNTGHSSTPNGSGTLTTTYANLSINNSPVNINSVASGSSGISSFSVDISTSAQVGDVANLTYTWNAAPYTTIFSGALAIGQIVEDWETDPSIFNWTSGGSAPWYRDNTTYYEGDYSMRSGSIGNNQTSQLIITVNVISEDDLSFYYKVSSENNYDFLKFYVDGNSLGEWSGEVNWSQFSTPLQVGEHTLTWSYEKDYSASDGSDAAWVDYIEFPPISDITEIENILGSRNAEWNIYPVPAHNQITIDYTLNENSKVLLQLFSGNGKLIKTIACPTSKTENTVKIDISNIPSGTYYLKMKAGDDTYIKKVIKE